MIVKKCRDGSVEAFRESLEMVVGMGIVNGLFILVCDGNGFNKEAVSGLPSQSHSTGMRRGVPCGDLRRRDARTGHGHRWRSSSKPDVETIANLSCDFPDYDELIDRTIPNVGNGRPYQDHLNRTCVAGVMERSRKIGEARRTSPSPVRARHGSGYQPRSEPDAPHVPLDHAEKTQLLQRRGPHPEPRRPNLPASLRHPSPSRERRNLPDSRRTYHFRNPNFRKSIAQETPSSHRGEGEEGSYFAAMELPGLGLLVILKSGEPLSSVLVRSLAPINVKLAQACNACISQERLKTSEQQLQDSEERYRLVG